MDKQTEEALAEVADARAYVGLVYGSIAVKWGPYTGPQAGQFMNRLLELDPNRKVPFFVSLELGASDDPVAEMQDWAEFEASVPKGGEDADAAP